MSNLLRYVIFVGILLTISCSPRISLFDQYAYTQVTSIKVDALAVMEEAVDNYSLHEKEARAVEINIQKMIEYERHRINDTITVQQWKLLNDPNRHLFKGFINRWKQKGKLDSAFVVDQQVLIGEAFDKIAELESGKIKPEGVN